MDRIKTISMIQTYDNVKDDARKLKLLTQFLSKSISKKRFDLQKGLFVSSNFSLKKQNDCLKFS